MVDNSWLEHLSMVVATEQQPSYKKAWLRFVHKVTTKRYYIDLEVTQPSQSQPRSIPHRNPFWWFRNQPSYHVGVKNLREGKYDRSCDDMIKTQDAAFAYLCTKLEI